MNPLQIFAQNITDGPGIAHNNEHLIEIVILLLGAFTLGYLLRLFLSAKYKRRYIKLRNELNALQVNDKANLGKQRNITTLETKIVTLEQKNNDLRMKISSNESELVKAKLVLEKNRDLEEKLAVLKREKTIEEWDLKTPKTEPVPTPAIKQEVALKPTSSDKPIDQTALKKIEGIGPKIQEILNAGGIETFSDLADKTADQLRDLLLAEGPQYKVHEPGTWPEQAALARDGKWMELLDWQAKLKGGKPE